MKLYLWMAAGVLVLHLSWILWVLLGLLAARTRPMLAKLHAASLLYSIAIGAGPWACPLTVAEQWLQKKAGMTPYQKSFLMHYLEAVIYPDVPQELLTWCAIAVCLLLLAFHVRRFLRGRGTA